jgi:hypothetical protein
MRPEASLHQHIRRFAHNLLSIRRYCGEVQWRDSCMCFSGPTELKGTLRTAAPKGFKRDCEDIIDLSQCHHTHTHTHTHINVSVRHTWNLELTSVKRLNSRQEKGKSIHLPKDWRKWGHTASTNERMIEEGIYQEITNDTEIRDECQEWNYSIWSINCSSIKIQLGINNWRLEEIRKIDTKIRKAITMYKMHHPKADIDRLY